LTYMPKEKWAKVRHLYHKKNGFDAGNRFKILCEVSDVLKYMGIKHWLTNGTALGVYRDGDFIPWDDDIDIDLYMEEFEPNLTQIKQALWGLKFVVRCTEGREAKISVFKHGEKLSLRGLYLDPTYKDNQYRLRHSYKYPRKFYETERAIFFNGRKFLIPSPTEEFLEYCYGKNWKTPLKSDDEREYSTKKIRR